MHQLLFHLGFVVEYEDKNKTNYKIQAEKYDY